MSYNLLLFSDVDMERNNKNIALDKNNDWLHTKNMHPRQNLEMTLLAAGKNSLIIRGGEKSSLFNSKYIFTILGIHFV